MGKGKKERKKAMGRDQSRYLTRHENGYTAERIPQGFASETQPSPPSEKIMLGALFKKFLLLYLLGVFALVVGKPVLEKRATQVSLISYTYTNGVLAGSINVCTVLSGAGGR